jgi:hypothetical protein
LCDGVVVKIVNANTRMVEIEWNEQKVMEGDPKVTRQKLMVRSWNPKNPSSGAWREFIGDPNAQNSYLNVKELFYTHISMIWWVWGPNRTSRSRDTR